MRETLRSVDEDLLLWTRAYRKRHGQTRPTPLAADMAEDPGDEIEVEWDDAEILVVGSVA